MDNTYIWIRNNGVIVSRGNTISEALDNLEKYYPKESLIETYKILESDGYYVPPTITLNGDGNEPVPKESVIIDMTTTLKEWKRW